MEKSIHSRNYKKFLKLLKTTRMESGVTQVTLAERLGVTQSFMSKCERGERRIDIAELAQLCDAMEVSLADFVAALEKSWK
jgi:transcriptional regulator with XRE-family HTH domain